MIVLACSLPGMIVPECSLRDDHSWMLVHSGMIWLALGNDSGGMTPVEWFRGNDLKQVRILPGERLRGCSRSFQEMYAPERSLWYARSWTLVHSGMHVLDGHSSRTLIPPGCSFRNGPVPACTGAAGGTASAARVARRRVCGGVVGV